MIYDLLHSTGQDLTAAQRERAQEDFKVLFKGKFWASVIGGLSLLGNPSLHKSLTGS